MESTAPDLRMRQRAAEAGRAGVIAAGGGAGNAEDGAGSTGFMGAAIAGTLGGTGK